MDFVVERGIAIPLRDGVVTRADVYRPATGGPWQVLLQRTPYGRSSVPAGSPASWIRLVEAGYAVVVQDCRGRFASEGSFAPFVSENDDGYDTVEWIATQHWCSGAVGMLGGSYVGATQWHAASARPPSLRAIAPYMATPDYAAGWISRGGVPELGFLMNWVTLGIVLPELERVRRRSPRLAEAAARLLSLADDMERAYQDITIAQIPAIRRVAPYFAEWLYEPLAPESRTAPSPIRDLMATDVPILAMAGWYDIFGAGMLSSISRLAGAQPWGDRIRLVVGPWTHPVNNGVASGVSFGVRSGFDAEDVGGYHVRWFDRWLSGASHRLEGSPARLFVMGANEWLDADAYPVPGSVEWSLHLSSRGRANSRHGNGLLSDTDLPTGANEDTFAYDPNDPVPSVGGSSLLDPTRPPGPEDQSEVETRPDVLVYTSEPLKHPLTALGPVRAELHFRSSAPDTDVVARLVAVSKAGRATLLTDGIVRCRFRRGAGAIASPLRGEAIDLRVDMGATGYRFDKGERVRLEITSSNFPRYARNPNTGAETSAGNQRQIAMNTVEHSARRPSRLVMTVLPT